MAKISLPGLRKAGDGRCWAGRIRSSAARLCGADLGKLRPADAGAVEQSSMSQVRGQGAAAPAAGPPPGAAVTTGPPLTLNSGPVPAGCGGRRDE
jgi:hypothetical protein